MLYKLCNVVHGYDDADNIINNNHKNKCIQLNFETSKVMIVFITTEHNQQQAENMSLEHTAKRDVEYVPMTPIPGPPVSSLAIIFSTCKVKLKQLKQLKMEK